MNDTQQALALIKQAAFDRGFKVRSEQYMQKQAFFGGTMASTAGVAAAKRVAGQQATPPQKGVTGPTFLDPNDKSGPAWNADGTRKGPAPIGPSRVSHPQGDPRQMRMYDPNLSGAAGAAAGAGIGAGAAQLAQPTQQSGGGRWGPAMRMAAQQWGQQSAGQQGGAQDVQQPGQQGSAAAGAGIGSVLGRMLPGGKPGYAPAY